MYQMHNNASDGTRPGNRVTTKGDITMDKNRKILVSILALLGLSAMLAVFEISLTMQGSRAEFYRLSSPSVGPGVGVVRINGAITMTGSADGLMLPGSGTAEAVLKRLDDLAGDSRIKAVVVRINSPGGTVAATQEIFQKLMSLRRKNIKLVASLGDVAASGGYYVAAACDHIIANPGSITGSIGVIAVSPNLQGLFQKLGIRMNVIKSGAYKDILSSYRDLTEEERNLIQTMIDATYTQFLRDVSLGRNIPIDDIRPVADGRVMSGAQAVEAKLVNETGGFETALEKARKLAKLPDDAPVYDDVRTPLDQFMATLGGALFRGRGIEAVTGLAETSMIEYRFRP